MDGFRKDVSTLMGKAGDTGLQATEFMGLSETQVVEKVGPLFGADQKSSGILASVSMAQFILESGYGKSELAQKANNCFGMKKSLSGNTWSGSAWDGVSVYSKKTLEQNKDGSVVTITADFRKYSNVEDSIAEHSAYLLGAMNGNSKRYDGLKGCSDYTKAAEIIKAGCYATSLTYVEKLCSVIEKWKLTRFDVSGEEIAEEVSEVTLDSGMTNENCPFEVKVDIDNLNIRKGAGTNTGKTGKYTGKGVFTIVEVRNGKGSDKGWGRLKSGAGWISLEYCEKG